MNIQQVASDYREKRFREARRKLDTIIAKADTTLVEPSGLDGYNAFYSAADALIKQLRDITLEYSIDDITAFVQESFQKKASSALEKRMAVDEQYEKLIEEKIAAIQAEHQKSIQEQKDVLDAENRIYLLLQSRKEQLMQYDDIIIDWCTEHGITSEDVTVDNSTFKTDELLNLYESYIDLMSKPASTRSNPVREFRKKVPARETQSIVLLVALILSFTPIFSVASLAVFVYLLLKQIKVKSKVEQYTLLLGLLHNIDPMKMGYIDVEAMNIFKEDKFDPEDDERLLPLIEAWDGATESLPEEPEEDEQLVLRSLLEHSSEIEATFKDAVQRFESDKNNAVKKIEDAVGAAKENQVKKRNEVKLLGTEISSSAVFNTSFRLGLREDIIEESVDFGLTNLVIRPCKDTRLLGDFLKILLANAFCNVRCGNLNVTVYDPNDAGQSLIGFYDQKFEGFLSYPRSDVENIMKGLRDLQSQNLKELRGKDINEYNLDAEKTGKVVKEYSLLIVLSQAKKFEEDEEWRKFISYSAKQGVFIWLVSEANFANVKTIKAPFEDVANPYPDADVVVSRTRLSMLSACGQFVTTILDWHTYIDWLVPKEKQWSYCAYKAADIDLGFEDGDPEKPSQFALGSSGQEDVHGIIVGTTGTGKSVLLNNIIATLCYKYSPSEIDLWLIDFKRSEFSFFLTREDRPYTLPHIKACLCTTDGSFAQSLFDGLKEINTERQKEYQRCHVKNITKYNQLMDQQGTPEKKHPRIILINDEFQVIFENPDAKMKNNLTRAITDIAKLGRSQGIHLIFASQSMSGTLSADVLNQFTFRVALKCDTNLSRTILDTDKAGKMKEPRGYCYAKTKQREGVCNKYKVPYIEDNILVDLIEELHAKAVKEGYKEKDIIQYDEAIKHDISELDEFYSEVNRTRPDEVGPTGRFFFGELMVYSKTRNTPYNDLITAENNMNMFAQFELPTDMSNFYKQIMCNLKHFREKPTVLVNCPVTNLHYVCNVEEDMPNDEIGISKDGVETAELIKMFGQILVSRQEADKRDDALYYILIGWDQVVGIGVDEDSRLTGMFETILKTCGEFNMHFIFIVQSGAKMGKLNKCCTFHICGKSDEDRAASLLDVSRLPSSFPDDGGCMYIRKGSGPLVKTKIYDSHLGRGIANTTFTL